MIALRALPCLLVTLLLTSGCNIINWYTSEGEGAECADDSSCQEGLRCVDGTCRRGAAPDANRRDVEVDGGAADAVEDDAATDDARRPEAGDDAGVRDSSPADGPTDAGPAGDTAGGEDGAPGSDGASLQDSAVAMDAEVPNDAASGLDGAPPSDGSLGVDSATTTDAAAETDAATDSGVDAGLVAYYPFNGNANDESGNGNNGTVSAATLTSDRFGTANSAFAFSGSEHIEIPDSADFHVSQVSVSAWIRPLVTPNQGSVFAKDDNQRGYALVANETSVWFHAGNGSWTSTYATGLSNAGTWCHLVGTYDGNAVKLYINNVLVDQTTWSGGSIATGNGALQIGRNAWYTSGPGYRFVGDIDDLRIYNRAISDAEISALYHAGGWDPGSVDAGVDAGVGDASGLDAALDAGADGGGSVTTKPFPLAAGWGFTCSLRYGVVDCWGLDDFGQTDVPILVNPKMISAGTYHVCAIDDTGLVCWGGNQFGQSTVPGTLGIPDSVAAGGSHTCALKNGIVTCWGRPDNGRTTPPTLTNPTAITAADHHSCAIDDTGVVCWGRDIDGESSPPTITSPTQVDVGDGWGCALGSAGVQCWGRGWSNISTTVPSGLVAPSHLACGGNVACVIDEGQAKCWGNNVYGQATAPALSNPTAIAAGNYHVCAIDDTGIVCWGRNDFGQATPPVMACPVLTDDLSAIDSNVWTNSNFSAVAGHVKCITNPCALESTATYAPGLELRARVRTSDGCANGMSNFRFGQTATDTYYEVGLHCGGVQSIDFKDWSGGTPTAYFNTPAAIDCNTWYRVTIVWLQGQVTVRVYDDAMTPLIEQTATGSFSRAGAVSLFGYTCGQGSEFDWVRAMDANSCRGFQGPIAYYSFDDGTAKDLSTYRRDGTLNGSPVAASGVMGHAIQLGATSDDYVALPADWSDAIADFSSPRTFMIWFKATQASPAHERFMLTQSDGAGAMYIRQFNGVLLGGADGCGAAQPQTSMDVGRWYQAALTWDGTSLIFYVDGDPVGELSCSAPVGSAFGWHLGTFNSAAPEQTFVGLLDEVKIYSRVLSSVEIQAEYNALCADDSCNSRRAFLFSDPNDAFNLYQSDDLFNYIRPVAKAPARVWDFDLSPAGDRIAVSHNISSLCSGTSGTQLDIYSFPDFGLVEAVTVATSWQVENVAYSPAGDKIAYMLRSGCFSREIYTHAIGGNSTLVTSWSDGHGALYDWSTAGLLMAHGGSTPPYYFRIIDPSDGTELYAWTSFYGNHDAGFVLLGQDTLISTAYPSTRDLAICSPLATCDWTVSSTPAFTFSSNNRFSLWAIPNTQIAVYPSWNSPGSEIFEIDLGKAEVRSVANLQNNMPQSLRGMRAPLPSSAGLMLYYPFNGDALDASGNGRDPIGNTAVLAADRFGRADHAYAFDGRDHDPTRAQIGYEGSAATGDPFLSSAGAFSISVWFLANAVPAEPCVATYNFDVFRQIEFGPTSSQAGKMYFGANIGGGSGINKSVVGDAAVQTGVWYHAVATYDGSTIKLYVNGVEQSSSTPATGTVTSHATYTGGIRFGSDSTNPTYRAWDGLIDDPRVYDRALSPSEIWGLYQDVP